MTYGKAVNDNVLSDNPAESCLQVDIQVDPGLSKSGIPDEREFLDWSRKAYEKISSGQAELSIIIVDDGQGRMLNKQYRGKDRPTNVLSFPAQTTLPDGMKILGDIVICAPVVLDEAEKQSIPVKHHWMHMVVHGILHLMGYDHENDLDAEKMESLESHIMLGLGAGDPYQYEKGERIIQ